MSSVSSAGVGVVASWSAGSMTLLGVRTSNKSATPKTHKYLTKVDNKLTGLDLNSNPAKVQFYCLRYQMTVSLCCNIIYSRCYKMSQIMTCKKI